MALTFRSNKGQTFQAVNGKLPESFEVAEIIASTAETALVPFSTLLRAGAQVGPVIQAGKGGAVAIYLTLDEREFALKPANDSLVAWGAVINVAAGIIQAIDPPLFTVAKIVFAAPNKIVFACM
jgi:hypothetical protein